MLDLSGMEKKTRSAVAHYWRTLDEQSARQLLGSADRGHRASVTGGRQMNGFAGLVRHVLTRNGLKDSHIHVERRLELPGFFRPTKEWDMLVVHDGTVLAALEFKSQRGPSFGNNFNNRTEEAIGTGHDLATAYREGALGPRHPQPWLGLVMLLEDCEASNRPVKVKEPHFPAFPEFRDASYTRRYELLLRKLVREKLFNATAFLTATQQGGPKGRYQEPAEDLTMRRFLAGRGGHVAAYLAERQ